MRQEKRFPIKDALHYKSEIVSNKLMYLLQAFVSEPYFFEDCLLDQQIKDKLYYCFEGATLAQRSIFNALIHLCYRKMHITKRNVKAALKKACSYKNNKFSIDITLNKLLFNSHAVCFDGMGITTWGRGEVEVINKLYGYRKHLNNYQQSFKRLMDFYAENIKDFSHD